MAKCLVVPLLMIIGLAGCGTDPVVGQRVSEASQALDGQCATYTKRNTNNATSNFAICRIPIEAGQTITLGTCGLDGASGSGDTYLRLYLSGRQVAVNDNGAGCGWLSLITYTASQTATYVLREGCRGASLCSGTSRWSTGCAPESDAALCARLGAECGDVSGTDNCGNARTASCGSCEAPETCGGAGTPNVCGSMCAPSTCALEGKDCGEIADGCGGTLECGTCQSPDTCGGAGTPNVCGSTAGARVIFLHHSTGGVIWDGGVADWFANYNQANGTSHVIVEQAYPDDPYPWENYPYDYWWLWVANAGPIPYLGQSNLESIAQTHDLIVLKHCFPVSDIVPPDGYPDVTSPNKTRANYELQYEALKTKMQAFPQTRFVVWTGSALRQADTNPEAAERARSFASWVTNTWDEAGDNIFVWDFRQLETNGGLYLLEAYSSGDSHPNSEFAQMAAPLFAQRVMDVINGGGG